MKPIFSDTRILDQNARDKFCLTNDIMMENAAAALERQIPAKAKKILIMTGGGDNGGDGMVLARRCHGRMDVTVLLVKEPKSDSCVEQYRRAKAAGCLAFCSFFSKIEGESFDVVVDCIFGSGFSGILSEEFVTFFEKVNAWAGRNGSLRIACDIPSALAFKADVTVTMGALKIPLFLDAAKDLCGRIVVADLGICRSSFEDEFSCKPSAFLLEQSDALMPERAEQNVHKGTFGHAAVACGERPGAAVLASCAAASFGAGLVSIASRENPMQIALNPLVLGHGIMASAEIPAEADALAAGMGLGRSEEQNGWALDFILSHKAVSAVIDADLLYSPRILKVLEERPQGIVLTPHPKELCALASSLGLGDFMTSEVAQKRFEIAQAFAQKFPEAVLVIKGAYTLVCCGGGIFVAAEGTSALAKGGSGDVLAGMICSLLAQKYSAADAAKTAVIAHGMCAAQSRSASFALTPAGIIERLRSLAVSEFFRKAEKLGKNRAAVRQ